MTPDWSKLIDTPMGNYVLNRMDSNPDLRYHNSRHIKLMYIAAESKGFEYDADLDAAILWHDAVYDDKPFKEERSVDLFLETVRTHDWAENLNVDKVVDLILTTKHHAIDKETDARLIMLDLDGLAHYNTAYDNAWDILAESMNLYKISKYEAAEAGAKFLLNLYSTIMDNRLVVLNSGRWDQENEFWTSVSAGIERTVVMYQTIRDLRDKPQ